MIRSRIPDFVLLALSIVAILAIGITLAHAQIEGSTLVGPGINLGMGYTGRTSKFYNSTGDYLGESKEFRDQTYTPLPHWPNRRFDIIPSTPYIGHLGRKSYWPGR